MTEYANDPVEVRRGFMNVWWAVAPPGRLLVGRVTGSRAYGTARPESDWDWGGIYVTPPSRVLAMEPPAETASYNKGEGEDWTFHEARKFLSVLASGNVNTLEALFLPDDCIVAGDEDLWGFWKELVQYRHLFLTQHVLTHTLNYAGAQLRRVRGEPVRESRKRPNKPVDRMKDACHGVRLLYMARAIAQGSEPNFRLEGAELATVKSVRAGHVAEAQIVEVADDLIAEVRGRMPWDLPEAFPLAFANDWLYRLRRHEM